MKKFTFVILGLLILVLIVGCSQKPAENNVVNEKSNVIEITSSGFNPCTLTMNAGDTVTFVNKDSKAHWPASAVHPTHSAYPAPGGCIGSKFDACKGLAQGEDFSFKFDVKGAWKYHDHLNPSVFGTIIVQ